MLISLCFRKNPITFCFRVKYIICHIFPPICFISCWHWCLQFGHSCGDNGTHFIKGGGKKPHVAVPDQPRPKCPAWNICKLVRLILADSGRYFSSLCYPWQIYSSWSSRAVLQMFMRALFWLVTYSWWENTILTGQHLNNLIKWWIWEVGSFGGNFYSNRISGSEWG